MDETAEKGMEVKGANRERREIGRIVVSGYDTGRPLEHVERELKKNFASCGEITDVCITRSRDNTLSRGAFIYFVGEGAVDKAIQLNGSDMEGWTVSAWALPFDREDGVKVLVKGYDTSLSKSDLQCKFSELFSSCGKMDVVRVYKSFSLVSLVGEEAADKAPKLSGSDMGGHKVVVQIVCRSGKTTVHRRRHKGHSICGRRF